MMIRNCDSIDQEQGKGFAIIKSHAIKEGIAQDIFELFNNHECIGVLEGLNIPQRVKLELKKLFIIKTKKFYANPDGDFFNTIYPSDTNKPYFNLLKQLYSGENIIIELGYNGTQNEMQGILKEIKGRNTIIDENGKIIVTGYGIRGHLMKPIKYIPEELFLNLNNQFPDEVLNILNNYIHTTDTKEDYERILSYF